MHPEILRALEDEHRDVVEELEETLGVAVRVEGDPGLHHEHFDIAEIG